MINTWFTSDTHFGHKNILEYEKVARPFATIEEMHEVMIDRWNSVVAVNDIVYHLGDFCFGRHWLAIAKRLKGKKKLVMGNHDTYPTSDYLLHFEKCYGVIFWRQCILSHVPVHPNGLGARWFLNVHGHLHSRCVTKWDAEDFNRENFMVKDPKLKLISDENYFNVSVEQNNLTPFHSDIIMERVKSLRE